MIPDAEPSEVEYLHLAFRASREGSIRLLPSFHSRGPAPPPAYGPESSMACELRGDDGDVLVFHRCHMADFNADRDSPYVDYRELIPWKPNAASVGFLRDGADLAAIDIEPDAPDIAATGIEIEVERDRVALRWSARDAENNITYILRYSTDAGRRWRALAAGLIEPRFTIDPASLPGGTECIFQVLASSGIRTSSVETPAFPVDVHPRRAHIVSPASGSEFSERESVVLSGTGYSADFGTAGLDEVTWASNVDGFLGYGGELVTHTLSRGAHTLTLGVADGLGGEASAATRIVIRAAEPAAS